MTKYKIIVVTNHSEFKETSKIYNSLVSARSYAYKMIDRNKSTMIGAIIEFEKTESTWYSPTPLPIWKIIGKIHIERDWPTNNFYMVWSTHRNNPKDPPSKEYVLYSNGKIGKL